MFEAKYLSMEAKAICKHRHFTPRYWEPINADRSMFDDGTDEEYPVLRIWNSKREIIITNLDMQASYYLF